MITLRIKVLSYCKTTNTCKAELLNGDIVDFDPYVGCAIELSDIDYEAGKGADIIDNSYLLVEYYVSKDWLTPVEGGMLLL